MNQPPGYDGPRLISIPEAAVVMQRSIALVRRKILDGYLDSVKIGRRRWVVYESAAMWGRLNALQKVDGGKFTYNGWKHRAPNLVAEKLKGRPNPPAKTDFASLPIHPREIWITGALAAEYVGVAFVTFNRMARRRGMAMKTRGELGLQKGEGQGKRSDTQLYALSHVHELMDERDRMWSWRSYTPEEWRQYHSWKPRRFTDLEDVPAGDTLIDAPTAASILECSVRVLYKLARRGRLMVWQKEPGKPGSRMYFSVMQICRYAQDPLRVAHKKGYEGTYVKDPEKEEWNRDFLHKAGIDPETHMSSGVSRFRDLGDVYTTRQTAEYLGTTPSNVLRLHRDRRLQGFRLPFKPGSKGTRKPLYFLKEDVHALLEDPAYRERRAAGRLGEERKRERDYLAANPPEPTEEEWQAFQDYKRRLRAEGLEPNLTNHSTRGGW